MTGGDQETTETPELPTWKRARGTTLAGSGRAAARRTHALACSAAIAMFVMAGCGSSTQQQTASNLKSFLNATSIDQIQCSSQGTDGNGNPIKSCSVTFETTSCTGTTNGAPNEEDATVVVDGTQPQSDEVFGCSPS